MKRINLLLILVTFILKASPGDIPREAFRFYHLSKPAGKEVVTRSFKGDQLHQEIELILKDRKEDYRLKLMIQGDTLQTALPDLYQMEIVEKPPRVISVKRIQKELKVVALDQQYQIKLKKSLFIFEPPVISLFYPIIAGKPGKRLLLLPSQGKVIKALLKDQGERFRVIRGKNYRLKKYFLFYGQVGFEIFTDQGGRIALVNSQSMGYRIERIGRIYSLSGAVETQKPFFSKKGKYYLIDRFPFTFYHQKGKKGDVVMLPDFGITDRSGHPRGSYQQNQFYHDFLRYFHEKGFGVYLPTMERFKPKDISKLTLNKKSELFTKLVKKISRKKRPLFLVSLGEGSIFALKLKEKFGDKITGIVLLNPHWRNYVEILQEQANHPELPKDKRRQLLKGIAELALATQGKEKLILINQIRFSLDYFRELFTIKTEDLLKKIAGNIAIATGSYDLEVSAKNGWYLSSHLQNRGLKTLRYQEFNGLNHFFYKIPYASYAFEADQDQKISGKMLRWVYRFMKQALRKQ